jgi:hypothetical protein
MVKLKAPMMSLGASGSIGGAVVFSSAKGRAYARQLVIPSNPKSGPQVGIRAMMKFLSQQWTALSGVQKADWDTRAAQTNISPFNAFVAYNLVRWRSFLGPSKLDPADVIAVAPAAPTTTVTAGVRQLGLSIADGAQLPDWGWMIFRSLTTGFTPAYSNLVAIAVKTASPTLYVDAGLTAVAHFYRIKGFMIDGKLGTLEAERTGTPT